MFLSFGCVVSVCRARVIKLMLLAGVFVYLHVFFSNRSVVELSLKARKQLSVRCCYSHWFRLWKNCDGPHSASVCLACVCMSECVGVYVSFRLTLGVDNWFDSSLSPSGKKLWFDD